MSSTVLENMEILGSSIAVRFGGGFSQVFFSVAEMCKTVRCMLVVDKAGRELWCRECVLVRQGKYSRLESATVVFGLARYFGFDRRLILGLEVCPLSRGLSLNS